MNCMRLGLLAAAASALVFAGCGDSGKKGKSSSDADEGTSSSGTPFFSKISSANADAQMKSFAISGRRLIQGIVSGNVDREACGKPSLWPHIDENDGKSDDTDDIGGQSFLTSTDYFRTLLDAEKMSNVDEWNPYVEDVELRHLAPGDMAAAKPGNFSSRNVAWIVVAGLTDDLPDFVPVLISANVNPEMLITSGSADTSNDKRVIPLGRKNGAPMDLFGDNQGVVVITKGGSAMTYKAEDFTMKNLYQGKALTIPDGIELKYLQP